MARRLLTALSVRPSWSAMSASGAVPTSLSSACVHLRNRSEGWPMPRARRFCQTVPKVRAVNSATSASRSAPRRASSSFVHGLGLCFMRYADQEVRFGKTGCSLMRWKPLSRGQGFKICDYLFWPTEDDCVVDFVKFEVYSTREGTVYFGCEVAWRLRRGRMFFLTIRGRILALLSPDLLSPRGVLEP